MIHIELQSFDLFNRIETIHVQPPVAPDNVRAKYILLHKVLEQACYELTANVTFAFANLFSRLDYICKEKKMTPSDRHAIQTMRRNCNAALRNDFRPDVEEYRYDLRALVRFVALGFDEDIPASLLPEIPHSNRPYRENHDCDIPYLRASVSHWNDTQIFATTDSDTDPFIIIDYDKGGIEGDLLYLKDILTENLPINLLDVRINEEKHYIPSLIVTNPDYLIDISSLAQCFQNYGHHPLNYFINRIKPRNNTYHTLLGNLAGQFLDDYINEQEDCPVSYSRTVKKFFTASALEFCACELPADFHAKAQEQMINIHSFVHNQLPANVPGFDKKKNLLEASFICEKLGLQGRVDMVQNDFSILIEQKSGKKDEFRNRHKEEHFVQMMLYQGILMYNFGQRTNNLLTFLLYSKYSNGLMIEHFDNRLFRESIHLRNRIVANEIAFSEGAIGQITEQLTTDLLNEKQDHGKLWSNYQEPELEKVINSLKRVTHIEKAYFQRFFTFVYKEQVLSKTGGKTDTANGFAGTWHTPLNEKTEAGNILTGLTLHSKRKSEAEKGYDLIELDIPRQEDDFLPNFRTGDIIILYTYRENPDVRAQVIMKGNILNILPERITIQLRNGQQNKDLIGNDNEVFAIEHDASDTSFTASLRGLYAFLSARPERKALLLGQSRPSSDSERTLNGSYGRFDELILKEKQANDYFLLVGPPGTGKTSCALRYMVEEALSEPDSTLLLLSYTNRAVDEICDMLVGSGISRTTPFIRIGNEQACDPRFAPYLLKNSLKEYQKLADIRRKIVETRIVVATTSAINSKLHLFRLKRFSLAIIDEASQILEPDLTGILSARHNDQNAIDKFVLIGDYKQLPAIAQQSAAEAEITDPVLRNIGLYDCRNSLFERLYRRCDPTFCSVLRKQGRMHPAIAEFPDITFYRREKLSPIPLPHQEEAEPYARTVEAKDNLDRLITTRRMVFIPAQAPESPSVSEKSNANEARIVATLLARIHNLSQNEFNPHKTVGVIVPYRNQISMIRKEIARYGISALNEISIDTVERYQGSQRDVIIYSFTIHNLGQLNFLASQTFSEKGALIDRKLNVAITRARKQLFLTGNPRVLGENLTFYKLMEYIRLHNGYIETTADAFCRGDFTLPEYETEWELKDEAYPLAKTFRNALRRICPLPDTDTVLARELTAYGRIGAEDFPTVPGSELIRIYNAYYLPRYYSAARALYEENGNRLRENIASASGRIVFCDFAYESGASGLAFADFCRNIPRYRLNYINVCPVDDIRETAGKFFHSEGYSHITAGFYPHLNAVPAGLWSSHPAIPEFVVLNFSNVFNRIGSTEARRIAAGINCLIEAYPQNRYLCIFRDDAGEYPNEHSYRAFRTHLTPGFNPQNNRMPFTGKFYYRNDRVNCPASGKYLYEILIR